MSKGLDATPEKMSHDSKFTTKERVAAACRLGVKILIPLLLITVLSRYISNNFLNAADPVSDTPVANNAICESPAALHDVYNWASKNITVNTDTPIFQKELAILNGNKSCDYKVLYKSGWAAPIVFTESGNKYSFTQDGPVQVGGSQPTGTEPQ